MPSPNVVSTSAITIHNNKPNQTVFFNTTLNIRNQNHKSFLSVVHVVVALLVVLFLLLPLLTNHDVPPQFCVIGIGSEDYVH
jgi:hypothetical protein